MKTKDKGSIGELKVMADLSAQEMNVAQPHGDNLPFDLIAIDKSFNMFKVQVKYVSKRNGAVELKLASNTSTKTKRYDRQYTSSQVDIFAIYCPDNDQVYYISQKELGDGRYACLLRIDEPTNKQSKNINWAVNYQDIIRTIDSIG